jgi:PAS domain S-box-containing protein
MANLRAVSEQSPASVSRELLESERRFRLLVEGVVDYAIYMIDPDGIIVNWNAGAQRIKGYAADEVIGRHFGMFYTPEDRAAGKPAQSLAAARSEGRFSAEGWRVRKDGTFFWASVVIDAIRDDDGKLIGFAKITRDVTERR